MSSSSSVRALEQPASQAQPEVGAYTFGRFRIDFETRQLYRDEEVLPLTAKAFDVLSLLLRARNRTVSKDDLMRSVWHDAFVSEESLTQAIYLLRRALGDDSANPQYIATVARRGYRFIAPVNEVTAGSPDESGQPTPLVTLREPELSAPVIGNGRVRWRLYAGIAAAALSVGLGVGGALWRQPARTVERLRFTETAPLGTTLISGGVVSPDGRRLAFVARDNTTNVTRAWVKTFESGDTRALSGTDGAFRIFWSPDAQSVGFFAGGRLKTVHVDSGRILTLATVGASSTGGTWGSDAILFSDLRSVIHRVAPSSGAVQKVTSLDMSRGEIGHRWPQFLPDGHHFIYFINSNVRENSGWYVGVEGSTARVRILDAANQGVAYVPPGYLVFVRNRTLMAQPFDASTLKMSEPAVVVAGDVSPPSQVNSSVISGSADGMLTFGGGTNAEHLAWFDRKGQRLATVESPPSLHDPVISTDGRQLLAESANPETRGIWLLDVERGSMTRLTNSGTMGFFIPGQDAFAFSAQSGTGPGNLLTRSMHGDGGNVRLLENDESNYVSDWAPDGRSLVFVGGTETNRDIWLLERAGSQRATPLLRTEYNELQAAISPDGKWIAYTSDESGDWEVHVQAFPGLGEKRTISVGGGAEPFWSRDGHELFYMAADHQMMVVDVILKKGAFDVGRPRALFRAPISWNANLYRTFYRRHYAVTPDGQKFAIAAVDPAGLDPLTVVVNWTSGLKP